MKDGGAAFPVLDNYATEQSGGYLACRDFGMTLRDYFAGQVLIGWALDPRVQPTMARSSMAKECYLIADAMLAEREK